jgi:hypothetical protein
MAPRAKETSGASSRGWRTVWVTMAGLVFCWRARLLSVRPGPTSTRTLGAPESKISTPSAKRTVCRRWRTQYAGSLASASVIQVPVTFETNGIFGVPNRMVRQKRPNSSRMGSSMAECAATLM